MSDRGAGGSDLAAVLEYLQGIGWEEVYAPRGGSPVPAARATSPASAARPVTPPAVARPSAAPREVVAATRERGAVESAVSVAVEPARPAEERAAELAQVATVVSTCRSCRLAEGRKTVVFGTGNANADLMFIGEGPGAEEDRQGLPFVGPAGQLLDRIIAAIGLSRAEVYIANVVKCRPPGNRDPQPDEVAACRGFLESQVRLVAPKVIVALGRIAGQTLLGSDLPVGRLRGSWHQVFGLPLRVTYHPAALLRNEALKRPTWDDMQVVRDRLARAG